MNKSTSVGGTSTWKRIAIAGLCLMMFMAISAIPVALFFVPFIESLQEYQGMYFLLFFVGYTTIMIAFMQLITPYIFYYPATGTLHSKEEVCAELQKVSTWIPGVEVRARERKIQFRYTYVDVAFDTGIAHHKAKYTFIVNIRFHKHRPECTVTNVRIERYNIAPSGWGFGVWTWMAFWGMSAGVQHDHAVSFHVLQQRVVKEHARWNTEELQQAVLKTLTNNGWKVRASLF